MEPREPNVSPLVGAGLVFFILLVAGVQSPRPWSATGLAFVTFSALLASPDLIRRLLIASHHPFPRAVGRIISWPFKALRLALVGTLAILIAVLLVLLAIDHSSANGVTAAVLFFGFIVGYVEFMRRQLRDIARTVATGGDIDQRLEKRFGIPTRWLLAGALFLVGTVLQMVATYVE